VKSYFTDIFIKRPVLATVLSLLIFLVGLQSIGSLQVSQFPKMENTVITVTTAYPGASASVIQGFITAPLQRAIASAEGIDYMTSTSVSGASTITVNVRLNYDPQKATANVTNQVNQVTATLPKDAMQPVVTKSTGDTVALMYLAFTSTSMNNQQINDYLSRVVQPKLATLPGVGNAEIMGGQDFAMRIWLDPAKLASLNLTVPQVIAAINANSYQTAAGATKGKYVRYDVNVETDAHDVETFKNTVIKNQNGAIIRLKDVAQVELGANNYDFALYFDGQKGVFMGIFATPEANPLTVINEVKKVFPQIQVQFPPNFTGRVVYDGTQYIRDSINEVSRTIIEATIIVVIVIFLFLGALRSVIIPVVAIPLSLVGVCFLLALVGYSINLMTLLAMVLAIGLVVDDAIVVVENIYRHLEEGKSPYQSAIEGAREIATPVITMTLTLAAVYAPIGFLGGITGALFREFAFTLAMTVILSGVIALTLSPMLCSKVLTKEVMEGRFVKFIDRRFEKFKNFYQRRLTSALQYRPVTIVFAVIVLLSCVFMAMTSQKELAPQEDQGFILSIANGPSYANLNYTQTYTDEMTKIYQQIPAVAHYFTFNGFPSINGAFSAIVLKPWNERESQVKIQQSLQAQLSKIAGLQVFSLQLPSIPGSKGGSFPMQFVITTTNDYPELYLVSQSILQKALASGMFMFAISDLQYDKPEVNVSIDRDKAAALGVSMQDIGQALSGALGGNKVGQFSMMGQSYDIIPQVADQDRFNPDLLKKIYVADAKGNMVSLANLVTIKIAAAPNSLTQYQQQNSATISGMMLPGRTINEGIDYFRKLAATELPTGFGYDFGGEARQAVDEGSSLIWTFLFALVIIYLVLAAQFESFRDPFIILVSVPMSLCGALIFINLGLSTLNIYSGIGLVTLIGLISKHGILMVDFANKLQMDEHLSVHEAIIKAATLRLRPILMTTFAMVVGVLPLLLAKGPGAVSRFDIGLVIATGMAIGTCFTLFVVPVVYTFLAKLHKPIVETT
jgi:multidrug efflux pump